MPKFVTLTRIKSLSSPLAQITSEIFNSDLMLLCLMAGNHVVKILKWPLSNAKIRYSDTNQIAVVTFGTNHLGNFQLRSDAALFDGWQSRRQNSQMAAVECQNSLL